MASCEYSLPCRSGCFSFSQSSHFLTVPPNSQYYVLQDLRQLCSPYKQREIERENGIVDGQWRRTYFGRETADCERVLVSMETVDLKVCVRDLTSAVQNRLRNTF